MAKNRVFLPQDALDGWLAEDRGAIDGDTLTLKPDGARYRVQMALRFLTELAGGGDEAKLVGKVKDVEQLRELGAEHVSDSVILGDNAYQVVEGFVCEPLVDDAVTTGDSLVGAARAATGEGPPSGELDLLARFFLSQR